MRVKQKTKGKIINKAGIHYLEIKTPDGRKVVDVIFDDEYIRKDGKLSAMDSAYHLAANFVSEMTPELRDEMGKVIDKQQKKLVRLDLADLKIAELELTIKNLESKLDKIRRFGLNIKTGKGGSTLKSEPYDIRRELLAYFR